MKCVVDRVELAGGEEVKIFSGGIPGRRAVCKFRLCDEPRFAGIDFAEFDGGGSFCRGETVGEPVAVGCPCCAADAVVVALVQHAHLLRL